jgi:hypothetical protein
VGRGRLRWLADGGAKPTAGVGGGVALMRKRAQEPAVQLRCEAGRFVWTTWGRSGASMSHPVLKR